MKRYLLLLFILLCFFQISVAQENQHEIKIRQEESILNTSTDNNQLMKSCLRIAKEYIEWGRRYDAIKYYKKAIGYADVLNQYVDQYNMRLDLAQLYVLTGNFEGGINILNEAFEKSVRKDRQEDANQVLNLLENCYKQIGENQDELIKQRKALLDKLSSKVEETKKIENKKSNTEELAIKLNEVAQLKTQLERNDEESKQFKDLYARAQGSIQENYKIIQKKEVEIKEKNSKIKQMYFWIAAIIILVFILSSFLFIVIRKNLIVKEQKLRLLDQKNEIEKRTFELRIQNNEIEKQSQELIRKNKEIQDKSEELEYKNREIEDQSHELKSQNEELNKTLEYLRKTQKQLIQKEQMASLGKLMAGIAHEINTPLGAINSSVEAVLTESENCRTCLFELVREITDEQFSLFIGMLNDGIKGLNHYISTTEERTIKLKLKNELQELKINNCNRLSNDLINIGILELKEKYIPLLKSEQVELIMQTAYSAYIQFKNGFIIKDAVEKASKVIKALKFYSFTRNGEEMVLGNIVQSIESVLTLFHNQIKHKIRIEKEFSEIPQILCYPDQLSQVWTNLIRNSIQAITENGIIRVSIKALDYYVEIILSDNGCGIPDNIRDKIFDPFFTTKAAGEGTGLGLDIIKKIIEKHDGEISFDSKVGKGTSFKILLPIKE
jgi:two-component system, NtrC family, sensor kinase